MRPSAPYGSVRFVSVLALVLLILLLSPGRSIAQGESSAATDKCVINGTATDQTQAVVAGARAVLTSEAGEKLETQANEKGVYSFTGLKPGTYTLVVTAPNFAQHPLTTSRLRRGWN